MNPDHAAGLASSTVDLLPHADPGRGANGFSPDATAENSAEPNAGEVPDLRLAQIARLKGEIDALKQRLASRDQTIAALTEFRTEALSRLAAQHEEITRLWTTAAAISNVRRLPTPRQQPDHRQ